MSASLFHAEERKTRRDKNGWAARTHVKRWEMFTLNTRYTHSHTSTKIHGIFGIWPCGCVHAIILFLFHCCPFWMKFFFGKKCTLMRPFSIYCNKKMFDASILEFKKKWLTNRKIDVHKRSVWETQRDRRWKIIDSLPHCDYNEHCA